jgi:hypothetical protein
MDDERIERLLRGYRLPATSPALDRRVLMEGSAIVSRGATGAIARDVGRSVLHRLGFGYLVWLVDLVTTTDAEYRVEFI